MHHLAKFRHNRSNRSRDMAIFRFFNMAVAAILDFRNFKFLTVCRNLASLCSSTLLTDLTVTVRSIKSVELQNDAKFRQNRLNRGRYMAIFRLFQDGGLCNACVGTTNEGHLMVFITVKYLHVLRFREFGLKTTIHAPKFVVFLGVDPLNGEQCEKNPQKGTSLHESASFEPSCVKIRRRV